MHLHALGLIVLGRCRRQEQGQFPGEQALILRLGLEGFVQAFFTILRRGFALGLGQQRIEMIEGFAQFGARVEKQFQGLFMSLVGGRHVCSL